LGGNPDTDNTKQEALEEKRGEIWEKPGKIQEPGGSLVRLERDWKAAKTDLEARERKKVTPGKLCKNIRGGTESVRCTKGKLEGVGEGTETRLI